MGQKVSPIGFRTGVTIGWKSRWFAPKSTFGEFLVEDARIREFIDSRLNRQPPYAAISSVEIERTREEVKLILRTARPGLVIGPKGAEVDKLKGALEDLTNRRVNINILEVKNPDQDAALVAEGIAEQLKRRASFRRVCKQRAEATMQAGALGIKIQLSGRLGGAEMSRTHTEIQGSIPRHTLEADVDYKMVPCFTTYGTIGVKVWIYRGMFGEKTDEGDQVAQLAMTRARRRREGGQGTRSRGPDRRDRDERKPPPARPGGSRRRVRRAPEPPKVAGNAPGEAAQDVAEPAQTSPVEQPKAPSGDDGQTPQAPSQES